ncbi:MAG: Ferrous iron transport protein B [Bacteroidetes bacterium ADurb.Bin408]|nr:MAG: Ferrous iron transport protein B [Bacteroidetes bacterium ADurb.Bin408]
MLFISAFFPDNRGNLLFGIYLLGILTAIIVAILFKRILFRKKEAPFVMELPPFRIPTNRSTFRGMWGKGAEYLKKISSIILISSVIIWGFSHYPVKQAFDKDYEMEIISLETSYAKRILLAEDVQSDFLLQEKDNKRHRLEMEKQAELLEYSLLGRIGHFIEPVIKPLGFDWKMGIALLSGAPAKEIIVSTLNVLYKGDTESQNNISLIDKLKAQSISADNQNNSQLSPLTALTFMIFVLLYFPCIGTLVVISRESGHWKWGVFAAFYTTFIAWIAAFAVYNLGQLF